MTNEEFKEKSRLLGEACAASLRQSVVELRQSGAWMGIEYPQVVKQDEGFEPGERGNA